MHASSHEDVAQRNVVQELERPHHQANVNELYTTRHPTSHERAQYALQGHHQSAGPIVVPAILDRGRAITPIRRGAGESGPAAAIRIRRAAGGESGVCVAVHADDTGGPVRDDQRRHPGAHSAY